MQCRATLPHSIKVPDISLNPSPKALALLPQPLQSHAIEYPPIAFDKPRKDRTPRAWGCARRYRSLFASTLTMANDSWFGYDFYDLEGIPRDPPMAWAAWHAEVQVFSLAKPSRWKVKHNPPTKNSIAA